MSKRKNKEIDFIINNVWASFDVGCELDLYHIAANGMNVEYNDFQHAGRLIMRIYELPSVVARISSNGKITLSGPSSGKEAQTAAIYVKRQLTRLGYKLNFQNFKINNMTGTASFPFDIDLVQFAKAYKDA